MTVRPLNPNRRHTITEKITTPMGSMFCHVEHQGRRVIGIRIAHPQKIENTSVGELIEAICDGVTAAIKALPHE